MDTYQRALEAAIEILIEGRELSAEDIDSVTNEVMEQMLPSLSEELLFGLRKRSAAMLRQERSGNRRFRRRNEARWRRPLDELRMMQRIAVETGEWLVSAWHDGEKCDPSMFSALNHIFAKSLLVTEEIVCLVEGGFADGALARWRTLHELSVFALFISEADELTAHRYIAGFAFKAKRAALQINHHAEHAKIGPVSDAELKRLNEICETYSKELGSGLGDEFGWTRPWLKEKITRLEDLERATGLDHWRPRYRWASQSIHGGFRPPGASLGVSEASEPGHLVGANNGGMVDPLHMTAISLASVCAAFFTRWSNMDRLVVVSVLNTLCDNVGALAIQEEVRSLHKARSSIWRRLLGK